MLAFTNKYYPNSKNMKLNLKNIHLVKNQNNGILNSNRSKDQISCIENATYNTNKNPIELRYRIIKEEDSQKYEDVSSKVNKSPFEKRIIGNISVNNDSKGFAKRSIHFCNKYKLIDGHTHDIQKASNNTIDMKKAEIIKHCKQFITDPNEKKDCELKRFLIKRISFNCNNDEKPVSIFNNKILKEQIKNS